MLISCPVSLLPAAAHPYYFNQLSQGLDVISMAGEWLAATANTNMFTYEIAPVFSLMESEVGRLARLWVDCTIEIVHKVTAFKVKSFIK